MALLSVTDHGQEDSELWIHIHVVSIGENKAFATFLLASENYCNLLSCY